MGVRLDRPPPPPPPLGSLEMQWVGTCALRAQTLRHRADAASPLQAERAVVEYGAAAALERAAHLWSQGDQGEALAWMAAAEHTLRGALIPVPWGS